MRFVMAIDPGDKHVGLAIWTTGATRHSAMEKDASLPMVDSVAVTLAGLVEKVACILVVERFSLYKNKAQSQAGSNMATSQMIGALKYVAWKLDIPVVEQGADIKKPMRAQMRARGIKQVGKGGHARDAELHLAHYCLKEGLWKTEK